jgi:hypothetical protein
MGQLEQMRLSHRKRGKSREKESPSWSGLSAGGSPELDLVMDQGTTLGWLAVQVIPTGDGLGMVVE